MAAEKQYQLNSKVFIEKRSESLSGIRTTILEELRSTEFDSILQEQGVTPLIGGSFENSALTDKLLHQHNIVGLRQKIAEFNTEQAKAWLANQKIAETHINELLEVCFMDFCAKYSAIGNRNSATQYLLIFGKHTENVPLALKRRVKFKDSEDFFEYNVVFFEDPLNYKGKNVFYTIKERRIPVTKSLGKQNEFPDFITYINGIPLIIFEYKTESSGLASSMEDFIDKESYDWAPLKVALNDGRDVILFTDKAQLSLQDKVKKSNPFKWHHYLPEFKIDGAVLHNIDYLLNELICQPKNLYTYCALGCFVVTDKETPYLVNPRIQQYYALKDTLNCFERANQGQLSAPYAYLYYHAQRSGKTITMRLITSLVHGLFSENSFKPYHTIFFYVPDLQIKSVLKTEFGKKGVTGLNVETIETREKFKEAVQYLKTVQAQGDKPAGFKVFIVNMQKLQPGSGYPQITSSKILNIIDEAHHGQAQSLAELRDTTFPNSTNYLFTATHKDEMLRYYFGDNVDAETLVQRGLCSRFTLSDALACDTTVRVAFLKPSKVVEETTSTKEFSEILNEKITASKRDGSTAFDYDGELESVIVGADQVTAEIRKLISADTTPEKIKAIASFMDTSREGLTFFPKAIVYVASVHQANQYIKEIQRHSKTNEYMGYRWGIDHSSLGLDCSTLNPGIEEPEAVEKRFGVIRPLDATPEQLKDIGVVIDILVVVDKYQKGFDLPVLLATFLDASIGEPAKMSQIYTRAGTKFPGKNLGFCVDLTLDNKNKETFELAMALFDSKDLSLLINDLAYKKAMAEIELAIAAIKRVLGLKEDEFVAGLIVNKLFENVSVSERRMRQDMFFRSVQTIQNTLKTISATFFYRPYRLELTAIRQALETFKDIYADATHPLHERVAINLDKTAGSIVFSAKMIRQLILETLAQMDLLSIKDVVEIEYTPDKSARVSGSNAHEALMKRIQAETRGKSLVKLMDDMGKHLKKLDVSLYEKIKELLDSLKVDPSLVYEDAIAEKLLEQFKQAENKLNGFKSIIDTKYGGSALMYCAEFAFNLLIEQEYDIEIPLFKQNFCKHINSLRLEIETLIKGGRSLEERRKLAHAAFDNKFGFYSLNLFLSGSYGLPLTGNNEAIAEMKKIINIIKKDGATIPVKLKDDPEFFKDLLDMVFVEFFKVKEQLSK